MKKITPPRKLSPSASLPPYYPQGVRRGAPLLCSDPSAVKVDLTPYPSICRWLSQIQALPDYVGMPGMWKNPF